MRVFRGECERMRECVCDVCVGACRCVCEGVSECMSKRVCERMCERVRGHAHMCMGI